MISCKACTRAGPHEDVGCRLAEENEKGIRLMSDPIREGLADVDANTLLRHVNVLANQFPNRYTGEPQEAEAARYVTDEMKVAGLDVELRSIPVMGWRLRAQPVLEIIEPVHEVVECAPFIFSGSTPGSGVEGSLSFVGRTFIAGGFEWDKFALTDDSGNWLAIIVGRDDGPPIAQAGPPSGLAGTAETPLITWPSCVFGVDTLVRVRAWLDAGDRVKMRYSVQATFDPEARSYIVVAKVRGTVDPDNIIIVGCHHDSQGAVGFPDPINSPGANDNASGVAVCIELARHYRAAGCRKTLWFVSFGGEERNLILSRDFARVLNESRQLENVVAYVGVDQAAHGEVLRLLASDDDNRLRPQLNLRPIVEAVTKALRLRERFVTWGPAPLHAASDHWAFYFSGVPSFLTGWHPFDGYHRSDDTAARCNDDEKFTATLRIMAGMIEGIAMCPRFPPSGHSVTDGHVTTGAAVDAR